ncbi:MAG TPA: hypothetical protein VF665_09000 [Longimicrobium sp.]|jgi:hypothetical protein|uniref:hypothetical protein n=1 Tax=Longimicrobium sp. TaxID=2029185 RepID=UPI002EDBA79A
MKKLIAVFGILALAACGGDANEGAATEDTTTVVTPAAEPAPVTTMPSDTTMAPPAAAPMTGDSMAAGATTTPMGGDTTKGDSAKM